MSMCSVPQIKMEINQTIPPLTLNITYPFKSPRNNILLYLTNVAFSKVRVKQ